MHDIRYVCLSDTHFGADNSLLTNLTPGSRDVSPLHPSPVQQHLVGCLAALIKQNDSGTPKPTLILNGDILELALTTDNKAAMVFERFMELVTPTRGEGLFANDIIYIPGNHDHHLWETARERQYAGLVNRIQPGEYLPIPWHATNMFKGGVSGSFLDALTHRYPGMEDANFVTFYPNYGVKNHERKAVIFSHGHFVEPKYSLMTQLRSFIFPDREKPNVVWELEAENFAWIDFFWSTLGRSGDIGEDVDLIYDVLQDKTKIDALIQRLADGIAHKTAKHEATAMIEQRFFSLLLEMTLGRVAQSERQQTTAPLSEEATAGLHEYLTRMLRSQIREELKEDMPLDLTFVFGHTHKPFEDRFHFDGYNEWTPVYNTGGWVVDTPGSESQHGASAVLVDEQLNVLSIRFYKGETYTASVHEVPAPDNSHSPFYDRICKSVDPSSDRWRDLSEVIREGVTERRRNNKAKAMNISR